MARREWPLRYECAHVGCSGSATYRYASRHQLLTSWELKNYGPVSGIWKCNRHMAPNEVLTASNQVIKNTYISESRPHGIFWGGHGFMHGPGFKAYCKDFPPGTKLIVTAQIELPNEGLDDPAAT